MSRESGDPTAGVSHFFEHKKRVHVAVGVMVCSMGWIGRGSVMGRCGKGGYRRRSRRSAGGGRACHQDSVADLPSHERDRSHQRRRVGREEDQDGGRYVASGSRSDDGARNNDANNAPTGKLDSFGVVNASATYDVNKTMQLFGRVENLGDEEYEEIFGFSTPIRSVYGGVKLTF